MCVLCFTWPTRPARRSRGRSLVYGLICGTHVRQPAVDSVVARSCVWVRWWFGMAVRFVCVIRVPVRVCPRVSRCVCRLYKQRGEQASFHARVPPCHHAVPFSHVACRHTLTPTSPSNSPTAIQGVLPMCTVGSLVSYKFLSVPAPPSVFLPCGVGFEVVREVRVSVSCVRLPPKSLPPVSFCRLFTGTGTKTNEGAPAVPHHFVRVGSRSTGCSNSHRFSS